MKYIISTILSLSLIIGQIPASTAAFSDVKSTSEFSTAINALRDAGVVSGYEDGTFKEENEIVRAELLKIILEAKYDSEEIKGEGCFNDVSGWYEKYVCFAKEKGIVSGYDTDTFMPEKTTNFAELSKILSKTYNIEPEQDQTVWFKGYVEALESASAIPTTIDNFDKKITRGEMAEMMWRIDSEVTDKPTGTYYNIKHPESTFNPKSEEAQLPKNCSELETILKEFTPNPYWPMPLMMEDGVASPMAPMMRGEAVSNGFSDAKTVDKSFSTTNVQVQGVDEGDTVKTDGNYIYTLSNNVLRVTQVQANGSIKLIIEQKMQKKEMDTFYANELYLDNGYIVLVGSMFEYNDVAAPPSTEPGLSSKMIAPIYWNPGVQKIEVRLYKLNGSALTVERTVRITGNSISTRVQNNQLYIVSSYGQNYWYYPMERGTSLLPTYTDSALNTKENDLTPCANITILPRPHQPVLLSTSVLPLSTNGKLKSDTVIASGETVYMSNSNVYIAAQDWGYNWHGHSNKQSTTIYRFALTDDGVEYKATGKVPGRIINQFSMDEHENSFRIATTLDATWPQDSVSTNNLYVLNFDLDTVGSITNIAPDETIYSVRFMGDRAYMVTFKTVDPFFVLDTSDPRNPKILGELKLPGYSNYLHPYDENHVLGFGKDAEELKDFAIDQGMKVALFDVRDVSKPVLKDSISIGDRGTNSELLYNHKALLFEKDRNLLAFPVEIHTLTNEQKNDPATRSNYGSMSFQGALVYTITSNGFTERGRITHYTKDDEVKMGSYYYGKSIERILRIGSSLFTIGQNGIQSHNETTLSKQSAVEYTVEEPTYYPQY